LTRRRSGLVALLGLLWRASPRTFVALAAMTLTLGVTPNLAVLATGWFVSSVENARPEALLALIVLGGAFAVYGALVALVRWVIELANSALAGRFAYELGRACLAPRYVDVLEDPRVADELDALKEFETSGAYLQAVPAVRMALSRRIGGVGAAAILFVLGWWIPLVIVAGWLLAWWGASRWMRRGFDASRAESAGGLREAEYLRGFGTGAASAKEVRIFGLGQWLADRYVATWREAMSHVWLARRASSRDLAIGLTALLAAHAVVIGWIGWQASAGRIGAGAAVTFGMALVATADLGFLGDLEWRMTKAGRLARQLEEITTRLHGAATERPSTVTPVTRTNADVTIKGLRFAYRHATKPILDDLELHIPAGQSIAIVGENGAGKTTLLKLLCGLYPPDRGQISLVGNDRVAIIFQDFLRYELPLRENVAFGGLSLIDQPAMLSAALRDAGGDQLLKDLPHGWDTPLASGYTGGVDLSGGQWQRVALARALLAVRSGAGVLVLDEPTASLDVRAEAELFERFLDVTADVTTILVSHRLSGVRHADRIVVLADGRIHEDGTHDELIALNGRYASMFGLQARRFVDG
jgi:ATP-binding cassette subfamily B protein